MTQRRQEFALAAASYDDAAVLARETTARMIQRLEYVKLAPNRIADIGCATGDGIRELQKRYPKANALAVDIALPMLQVVRERSPRWQKLTGRAVRLINADVNSLPLKPASVGLVWSNLMLQWVDRPLLALKECHRVMEVGGLLMFSALGPDTLQELRKTEVALGSKSTIREFADMHDYGDMLLEAGFADPVMDMEHICLQYRSPRQFLVDQRRLGVRNAMLGEKSWQWWRKILEAWPRKDGNYPATFEIVYGHAWKGQPKRTSDGLSIINFHHG